MKYALVIVFASLFAQFSYATDVYEDSLDAVIHGHEDVDVRKEAKYILGEYLVQRNPEKAEVLAKELALDLNKQMDSIAWARLNFIFAASHRWQGNYQSALDIYQQNYDYFKRKKDELNIAKSGQFIGTLNMFLGNNTLAQNHLLETAEIYQRLGTERQKARINNSLAGFYLNIDQLEKGKERYLKALSAFEMMNDSAGMASCNANLGLTYIYLEEFEKAEMHLMRQKAYNAVFPTLREMGFHHDFLGLLRQEQGRLEEAYDEHYKALKIRENLSSTYNKCESKINTGEVLIKLNRNQEAIQHLKGVLAFEEHQSLNQESSANRLLAEAYENLGNHKKALHYYKDYKAISDSIYDKEAIEVIAENDSKYKNQEQKAEIALLNLKNTISSNKIRQQKIAVWASLFGLLIFGILSFFVWRLYQRTRRQHLVIEKALKDKDLLMHEIHHRVKNNLQIISSLLKLQSRYIKDEVALQAIEDGRNRVQSMAILHKNLYKEDDIKGVSMRKYFTDLTEGIFKSYNLQKEAVKLNLDVEDVNIDIDTVIPIGLITNELITNSLKYAFDEGYEQAKIDIKLKEEAQDYKLVVSDNGIGVTDEIASGNSNKSFGQKMIKAFVTKLKAKIEINNQMGTEVVISIPK